MKLSYIEFKRHAALTFILAVSGLLISAAVHAESRVFATQITPRNADELISKGPNSIGGIDDWFFTNGTLCGIVSDVNHESQLSLKGGALIDLGFCGRADDHFLATNDLLQGSQLRPVDSVKIELELNHQSATIVVYGERDGAKMIKRFSLHSSTPTQLHITKTLSQEDGETFNFFNPINFNYHSLEPFVLNSRDLSYSYGFQTEDFVSRGVSAIPVAARNADTIITTSPPTAEVGIAYGWQLKSAERVSEDSRYDLPSFALADDASNAMVVLSDTFYLGDGRKIGRLQLPQLPLLSLDESSSIETHEIIYVGKRGDVAAITDQLFLTAPLVSGKLNEINAAIHISNKDGTPFTHSRPDKDGNFTFRAPKGDYILNVKGTAKRQLNRPIEVSGSLEIGAIELPKPSRIALPQGHPMRLLFVGVNGTKSPDFANRLTGFSVNKGDHIQSIAPVSSVFLAGVASDRKTIEIAPGEYQVYATKGPEYTLEKSLIKVNAQTDYNLNIAIPTRAVVSPNYIASDLHVHSGISYDNAFSETERVRTFVAEHGEVMVSSEHDIPVNFAPRIVALGVENLITSIAAAEVTSVLPNDDYPFTNGHANFFPYTPQPHAYRRGMVNHENRRWREIIDAIKQQQGNDILVQLNHARSNLALSGDLPNNWEDLVEDGNFLDHMGPAKHPYNPTKPLHTHPNNTLIEPHEHSGVRDLDFDLMEVINPGGEGYFERIEALRRDWLSFIKQGETIVATANSDSHRPNEQVALPRTMVFVKDDQVSKFKQREFLKSLKSGNAYGTTGPLIEVSLSGAQMGETFRGQRGQLSLKIRSADWIPVTKASIQINGETVDQYQLNASNEHSLLIPLSFQKDSFVTVEVSGSATQDYQQVYPHLEPYAFSNPIYVDFDNDNEWQAPGL